jgi:hypothetical protein
MLPTAEIVRVIDDARLIDPESYERSYDAGGGTTLVPGYYVVVWPDHIDCPRYDAQARVVGPIVDPAEARRVLERYIGTC